MKLSKWKSENRAIPFMVPSLKVLVILIGLLFRKNSISAFPLKLLILGVVLKEEIKEFMLPVIFTLLVVCI